MFTTDFKSQDDIRGITERRESTTLFDLGDELEEKARHNATTRVS
jgi:hypothetical protein